MFGNLRTAQRTTRQIMWLVCLALVPGITTAIYHFGPQYGLQLLLLVGLGLLIEGLCLLARRAPNWRHQVSDGSTVVTALLIGLALPPAVPIGILALAMLASIGLAKHLFGGLGNNVFNPAMVGYTIILVSFPATLAVWPDYLVQATLPGVDALTKATPLDQVSHAGGRTFNELRTGPGFGELGGLPWQWLNLAYLGGGLALWLCGLIRWRVTLGVLLGLAIPALLTYDNGSSSSNGSPLFHWFTGATMLCAFFVATDPVTHPANRRGQWVFGLLVGLIVFLIRAVGSYPDGVGFAILLANCTTPWLEQWGRSRAAGDEQEQEQNEEHDEEQKSS